MASVSGMSAAQLQAEIDKLKAQGKTESTSKSLGKYVDALKVLSPTKYGSETVASAQSKLMGSTTPDTQAQLGIASPGGSTGGSGLGTGTGAGAPGSVNLNSIYDTALKDGGVSELEAELNAKKTALVAAQTNINDNPFYSEASRTGKLAKLDQTAQAEIANLENNISQKKADAQVKLNIATQQYNIDDKNYQNNLQKLNLLISSGAIVNASGADIAQIAQATGMTTSMVKSIQEKAKSDMVKPTVITNTDDNGNVTVSVIDGNTGALIGSNSLGSVGKADSGGASKNASSQEIIGVLSEALDSVAGDDGHVSETDYVKQRNFASSLGISPQEFDKIFGVKFVNPNYYESYQIVDSTVKDFFSGV